MLPSMLYTCGRPSSRLVIMLVYLPSYPTQDAAIFLLAQPSSPLRPTVMLISDLKLEKSEKPSPRHSLSCTIVSEYFHTS